ncbi:VapC toxin family PIN domain ribonuclease [Halobacteriales archaeon QS_4_69_225]|nr:MAG: VapC toxin family PIN domain ribonuclease [Halobacteriales archaeon QS_4_69_225]
MKLLDTTFLVDYERGEEAVAGYLEANEAAEFITSTLCVKELAVSKHIVDDPTLADVLAPYGWLEVVPFRTDHAIVAGEMEAELHADESVNRDYIDAVAGDLLIAAVARAMDATVVTNDRDDFERFDVAVEGY